MGGTDAAALLAGRDAEIERIEAAFADAAAGRPRILVILGEAGIGKTGLADGAIARARAAGGPVLSGACLDIGDGGLPYLPVAEALRGLARSTSPEELEAVLGPARDDLAAITPALGRAGAGPAGEDVPGPPAGVPSGASQARLFERFVGLLARLGADAPVLVVIEDVQWIDRATRDLVTFLVRNLTTERVVALLTCRVDDLPSGHPVLAWLAELGRAPGAERLELGRLDRVSVARMVANLAGEQVDPGLADHLWRRSDGNPLFVEELLAAERAGRGDREWRPASLIEILVARVAALSPPARRVADAVSIAGRPVGDRLLAAVLGEGEADVGQALREAIAHGVLIADRDDADCRFRHELLREVVERGLLPGERRSLHERFARLLEERPDLVERSPAGAAAELAHHWTAAGRTAEAYRASLVAAKAAEAVHAFGEAHAHLERALDLEARLAPDAAPTRPERLSIRRRAADMADLAGASSRAIELCHEALALVDPALDPTAAGILHGRLGYLTWVTGDSASAIAEHEEAVRLVPAAPSTAERAHVLGGLGGALMGAGRWAESQAVCDAAIACASEIGAAAEESRARNMLGSDLVALGRIDEGIEQLRRARELAQRAGPPELLIVAHHNLALNMAQADLLEEALGEVVAGRAVAAEAGLDRRFGQDLAALEGDILLRLGRWADAEIVTREALARAQARSVAVYLAAVRARLAALRGDREEAAQRLDAIDSSTLDPDVAAFVGQVRAEAALADGRPADALRAVADGLASLEGLEDVLWAAPLVGLGLRAAAEEAEAARASRDATALERASGAAAALRSRATWLADRAATRSARAWVALARAEIARLDDRRDPAGWRAAADLWDAVPDPHAGAYARFREAEASLRESGIRADVGAQLQAAFAAAERLGATPLRREIEALGTRARVALVPAAVASPAAELAPAEHPAQPAERRGRPLGLSPREIEVLALVAAGLSNGEIAERLFITRKTAAVHVTHILDKLGLSNRVEAAMAAARLGLAGGRDAPGEADLPERPIRNAGLNAS